MSGKARPSKDRAEKPAKAKEGRPPQARSNSADTERRGDLSMVKGSKPKLTKTRTAPNISGSESLEEQPAAACNDTFLATTRCTPVAPMPVAERRKKVPKKGDSVDGNPHEVLLATLGKLKIKKAERSESAKQVKAIESATKEHLKKVPWCDNITTLKTGSYYENLKISKPNEFDVMWTLPVSRVDIQAFKEDGAFYSLALKRHSRHPLDRFLREDKTIKASEMLTEFRKEVKKVVKSLEGVQMDRKKKGCPAVTMLVQDTSLDFVLALEVHSSSWPSTTEGGFMIDQWLGKKVKADLKRRPFYVVPKYEGNGNTEQDGVAAKDAWRISFSHIEKHIMKHHGNSKTCCETGGSRCCRKDCLKLLKHLLAQLKLKHPTELAKFCSYHAKTTLLHACASRVEDSHWSEQQLSFCFQQLLEDFVGHLRNGNLPNFFIPSHNLLHSAILSSKSCLFLAKCIEEEQNNGFPSFC